jgi:hypothetical protein
VLFFNAFELGAVIRKDAHVGAIKEFEAKAQYKNLKQEREHQKVNIKHI